VLAIEYAIAGITAVFLFPQTSVITSKAANGYHFKTGQRERLSGRWFSTPSVSAKATAFRFLDKLQLA
jgi:hypothetical protein